MLFLPGRLAHQHEVKLVAEVGKGERLLSVRIWVWPAAVGQVTVRPKSVIWRESLPASHMAITQTASAKSCVGPPRSKYTAYPYLPDRVFLLNQSEACESRYDRAEIDPAFKR